MASLPLKRVTGPVRRAGCELTFCANTNLDDCGAGFRVYILYRCLLFQQLQQNCRLRYSVRPVVKIKTMIDLFLFFLFFPPLSHPCVCFFEASEAMLRCFLSDSLTVVYFVGGRRWDEPVRGDGDECMCVFYGTSLTVKCLS